MKEEPVPKYRADVELLQKSESLKADLSKKNVNSPAWLKVHGQLSQVEYELFLAYQNTDPSKAVQYLYDAVMRGNFHAEMRLFGKIADVTLSTRVVNLFKQENLNKLNDKDLFSLGLQAFTGTGRKLNYALAYACFVRLAEKGNADAQLFLGYMYEWGIGVTQNYGKSVAWYEQSVAQGNTCAQCHFSQLCLSHLENPQRALTLLQEAEKKGNANAQVRLGVLKNNRERAVEWLSRAVAQAHPEGMFRLAKVREQEGDDHEACRLYERASELSGYYHFASDAGKMYEKLQDFEGAAKWYRKAAEEAEIPLDSFKNLAAKSASFTVKYNWFAFHYKKTQDLTLLTDSGIGADPNQFYILLMQDEFLNDKHRYPLWMYLYEHHARDLNANNLMEMKIDMGLYRFQHLSSAKTPKKDRIPQTEKEKQIISLLQDAPSDHVRSEHIQFALYHLTGARKHFSASGELDGRASANVLWKTEKAAWRTYWQDKAKDPEKEKEKPRPYGTQPRKQR
jgi:TPR repeat protein